MFSALVLYQDELIAFLDDGDEWRVRYEELSDFRVRRAVPQWKLTLRGAEGKKQAYFRIGKEMAANVRHVLLAKRVRER
jgi:hypothetical protein